MLNYFNAYVLYPFLEKKSGRKILVKQKELQEFEKLNRADQEMIRKQKAYEFFLHCEKNVPYYQDLFKKHHFKCENVLKDLKYIQDLPVLTKEIVKENTDRLKLSTAYHSRKTGGSTGQSVFFYYDNEGLDWTAAINLQAYEMAGKKRHHSDAHIGAELGIHFPNKKSELIHKLKLKSLNRSALEISSFSDSELQSLYTKIKNISPFLLQCHPSTAYALSVWIEKNIKITKKIVSIFEPSGEMLTIKMKESIEKNFKCNVVNRYGNAEFGVVGHSLFNESFNKLKVFERAFFAEECNQSNLVITNFTNYSFPLIRYNTGDIATVKCESHGTYICEILGRQHDSILIGNEKVPSHFIMDFLDHKVTGITEFQIQDRENSKPLLLLVPEKPNDEMRISKIIQSKWNNQIEIKFVKMDEFYKSGWQNKFKHIVKIK